MDGTKDPRCAYIGQTAAALFGAPQLAAQIAQAPEVSKFLNELNNRVLQILSDGNQFKCLSNQVANPPEGTLECHFLKVGKEEISVNNVQYQLMVSTIRGSSANALFQYISSIYAPILFGEAEDGTAKTNTQLRDILFSLKAGLQRTLRKGGSSLHQQDFIEEDVKGILSPTDEIEVWIENEKDNYSSQANEKLRRKAEAINQHFAKISKGFTDLDTMELGAINHFITQIQDTLDSIWQDDKIFPYYSQIRMEKFFIVTGKAFGARIEQEFSKSDVWASSFTDVRVKLNECMKICKGWKDRMTELTRDFWRSGSHPWKGKPFSDPYIDNMILRMNEIFELRSQHDELLRLLSPEEQKRLNVDQTFSSFKKVNAFYTNEYQAQSWSKAKSEYERILEPMEKEICAKLRKEIFTDKLTPAQLLREFQRWKGLVSKDSIKRELQNERENILVQLSQEVRKMKEDFESKTGQSLDSIQGAEKLPQTNNVSDVVSTLIWARQISLKVQSNQKVAQSLFGDISAIQKFDADCKDICQSVKDFEDGLYNKWQAGIMKAFQNPNEKYKMSGQLMEFDYEAGGLLKVNYSEKLVTLIKDGRALGEQGFRINKEIISVIENAKKYYKEGVTLKQVANFYNSMGAQIIECQKPMMLDKAQVFEYIIKNPKGAGKRGDDGKSVTWADPIEIEVYIQQVKAKATELISENRRLNQVHRNVIDMIIELMNVDLLKNKNLWKDNLNKIRKTIESVTKTKDPEMCKLWLTHLNYQLFKALEHQYQMGLESLNETLPEIQCDLVFRNQNIEFRPTFEELKQRFYKEISTFITTPLRFQGFGGGKSDIFKVLPERNAKHLNTVYQKAEELFQKVYQVQKEYVSWTALGQIDLQAYIEQNFKTVEDWESNFSMLKQKRRELKKLPDSVKVDCININLVPFKGGIEDIFKRLSDALVETLQTSIERDSEQVFRFIKNGLEKLNSNPQSVEEIEKMHSDAVQIQVEKEDIVKIFDQCEKKNLMIKQIAGQGMRLGEIESMWREFDARLNAFNDKIEDQKTRLRKEIDARAAQLNADLEKMFDKWQEKKPKERNELSREEAFETSEMMKELRTQWVGLQERITKIYKDCEHFKKERPTFTYYDKLKDELAEQEQSWSLFDDFMKEINEFGKEEWLTYRKKGYFAFQDFFLQQSEKLKGRNKDIVIRFLLTEIENFKQAWPLLKLCTGESFEREHWRRLITMLEMPKEVTFDNMKFKHLVDSVPVMIKRSKEIKELSDKAQGEVTIREAIRELRVWCDSAEFVVTDYDSNGRRTPLIKEWKEIMTQVSDNQSLLMSLKESRFFAGFADQIEQFEKKLGGVDDYLSKLNIIQRKWVYLEPIFIRGALPSEQGRFRRVDEEYRGIMLGIGSNPKVVALCEIPGLKDTLETILTQLEMCQKALNDFLEQKRSIFSRFYFIGDDDLLEILGQAKNPAVIQTHLKKLFAGIYKVEFDKNNTQIISMISSANEYVKLRNPVRISDDVELWLGELEKSMRDTLNNLLVATIKSQGMDIVNTPSQICQLSEMIAFSENCAGAVKKGKLPNYKQDLQKQLESYTSFDNKGDQLLFSKVKALILDIIHNVDVVEQLLKDGIVNSQNTNDWMWFKQLKYYMDVKADTSKVGMCDAFFDYTYEYQGNAPKLVHTPLTDKCYLTLVLGMKMGYGGNPYGPAGTGKTESVKALGQAFGRQVLVFNCDEGLDYKAMGRIFIGLVKCGAWGCFDEFNRLLEEQLSAISQQIQVIQWAIKEGQPSLELLGRRIEVNKNAGIFVTMNPAGKGYGGRSKLPDNLKQLFRPVAMSVPDNELIAETLLFSEGFKHAKKLSNKIVSLFKLCRQLLSDQQHYDWGLRALKTILNTGGQLIQNELKKGKALQYEQEALLLIKAIRINTMSKLTYADSKKYEALQKDMFPGINSEDIAYEELTAAIKTSLEELKLEVIESQIQKILQFYEATRQRMGVVIVGPSGCGKTTIWKVLKHAYEKMNQTLSTHVMNPKSMPRNQLLGIMNHDTREFNDGVLTASARAVVKEPAETLCWIVCDGDIDPEWVESLNSVLDDNHLLTLPNGERISFGNNVNFIFETNDLKFASPATVSRLGMIFLSDEDVDIQRITKTWIKRQDEKIQPKLEQWMEDIFYNALKWTLDRQEFFVVETTKIGIVKNALSYMNDISLKGQFAEACIKGLGGNFHLQLRQQFAQEVFNLSNERPADPRNLLLNFFDTKTGSWNTFIEGKSEVKIDDLKNPEAPPIVYTVNVQRDIAMIKPWLDQGDSFILVGPEGCGKNLTISNLIKTMKSTQLAIIHCNSQTSAFHVIQKLNQMCAQSTSSQGRVYRPKESQRLIIYLKDINLPKPDKYDTIQLISFLQQIVCYKGFYDENLEFVYLERIQIVASMNPSTTIGRHKISTRFTANVRIAYAEYPTSEELLPVYTEFMRTILSHPSFGGGSMANSCKKLSQFIIELFTNIKQNFSIDEHRHYLYTPRDITQLIFSILRYDIKEAQTLIEVLIYESSRIFKDRLVDKQSKAKFDQILYGLLRNHLKFNEKLSDTYFISKIAQATDRLIPNLPALGRITKPDFVNLIEQSLRAYEREFKEMNVHLFDELLELIAYTERVLSKPGGCILMAGRSGVGRKTTTQLIAHMLNMNFFSPNINRDYSMKEFKRDLKVVLQQAGIEAQKTCLLIEDHQVIRSEFLEYLNSLISAGEVPGLYTPEELEPILAQLGEEMRNQYECRTLFEFFVSRIQKNLSIVISMDHSHPKFLQYCAQNPALYTKCNIIWSEGWNKEAMLHVAKQELGGDVLNTIQKGRDELLNLSIGVQQACQHLGASPLKFLNFIQNFRSIFTKMIASSGGQSKHLKQGLSKLEEAAKLVDDLSQKAQSSKILLKQKQLEADQAMKLITQSLEQKAERKQEIEQLKWKCNEDEQIIQVRKANVEDELKDIQPEVDAAKELVGKLNAQNINEIKSYPLPPDAVSDVLQGVLRLMGQDDTSWAAMKKFIGQSGVVQRILNFDARQVSKQMRDKVNKIINEKPMSFEHSVIFGVSRACAPLAAWVKANVKYSEVLLKIGPLTDELQGLQNKLQKSQIRVQECQRQLDELDGSVQTLNANFAHKTQEAESLKFDLKRAEDTLHAAQSLLGQLSGENERWKKQLISLESELALVPVKSLLSSAYLTFLGGSNESVREKTLQEWLQMARIQEFNFRTFLSTESQLLTWKKEGLPADMLSQENAIMILNTVRTPLIIDPASTATEWLKFNLKQQSEGLEILNHQDPKFNTTLELSIRFGKVLIILEVDGIESMLFPVLRKDLIQQGPRQVVQIGEKAVDYNPNFKLFLCTRDSFVEIPPNAQALITTVNFTVTKSGLEGQLLSITINFEQPELESRKTQLLEEEERLKIQLAGYEKRLLDELASSEGNILENKSLIDSLNQTKKQSTQIEQALTESHKLQVSLDEQRNVYKNFAYIGSNLFMVIGDLIKINNMYQFSLQSFIKLFKRALETKPQASSTQEKLDYLSNSLIKLVYSEIGRSLFKADRLTYSLHFVKGVYPNLFGKNEWEFFSGAVVASGDSHIQLPRWASKDRKEIFSMFATSFSHIIPNLALENEQLWSTFMRSNNPEKEFPPQVQQRLSPFQRCILIQVFRPDRLESAMQNFVKEAFGNQTIQPTPFSMSHVAEMESTPTDPILFIISAGSDPSAELQEFVEGSIGRNAYHELAMGGGQNEIAIETLKQAATKGEWVCLKNLHLVTPWLPILEKEFKMLTPHPKFRLWLTSEPHPKFPSILLQSSLKITYETPPGVRNNLQRTFSYVASSQQQQDPSQTQLLFILSWFHALIQERRTYIPQGWSKYYEFSYGDLKAGETVLIGIRKESQSGIQWQKLYGILENAIYGGRVDNDFDLRVLRTYMHNIFKEDIMKGQKKLSDMIGVPQSAQFKDFVQTINQIPELDNPVLFGLPTNIDRSVQRFNSQLVISQLKSLAAVSAEELRFDKDKWTQMLGPICQLWSQVYKPEEFLQIKITQQHLSSSDPIEAFVYMEMVYTIDILQRIHEKVQSIIRVLQGSEMLTPDTEKVATDLLKGNVSNTWCLIWDGPVNPTQWIRVVSRKAQALRGWIQRVQQQSLLKSPVNLSDLFHPETFLNALRQKSARSLKYAIDELKLVSSFENGKVNLSTGVQLEGLWLQGCEFDGSRLSEIRDTGGNSPELINLPICSISWIKREDPEPYSSGVVNIPVYHSIDREKLLCTFNIPNQGEDWKRIIGGVALFLNGSD